MGLKRYKNRCLDCGQPVTIPGKNWAYAKELSPHGNQPFAMMKTGKIVGYFHRVCPGADPDDEDIVGSC